jgi:hypothetical protein
MAPYSRHFTLLDQLKTATESVHIVMLHELPFRVSLSGEYKAAAAPGGLVPAHELDFAP